MAVVAPPSPNAVVAQAATDLAAGLTQAQTDAATLASLLASWPSTAPAELQPMAQILQRVVNDLALVANAAAAIAKHVGMLPT